MKTITATLTEHELNVIFQALGELPLKVSGPVFGKLQSHLTTQSVEPARPVLTDADAAADLAGIPRNLPEDMRG